MRLYHTLAATVFLTVLALYPAGAFTLDGNRPASIRIDASDWEGVRMAAQNLAADFGRVTGTDAAFSDNGGIIVGTLGHSGIGSFLSPEEKARLEGRTEMYLMKVENDRIIIAGSDKRGTIYGIYSLSEKIGVSPWYWWADVPAEHKDRIEIPDGTYTDGEPAVRYRGIFLNDEAPCLTSWVKNTFGTDYGGHEFYEKVFELLLRLKANFMWPAMWGWSFYADDPENSKLADTMGIIMGTSHHEPMARNHQEWARHRDEYGAWDYASNKKVIDRFFTEGVERSKDNEDLITIGMRGDGDTALGGKEGHDDEYVANDKKNMKLLENIIVNQRRIIKKVTGKPAEQRPQVWALYKEVQKFYDLGLRVPDDVTILLSDDNWGDVRKLPCEQERTRSGGWGMYYHVDYVGAPRNSKWLNVTPIQNLWEQMQLTYAYGVDRLWVLNVGDLKPMEYPISLFLSMAWNPGNFNAANLLDHTRDWCAAQFGEDQAAEAARILNLYSKYSGRTTAEMMDCSTYNLESGEFKAACDEWLKLEAEALRQFISLKPEYRDAYRQLILFPVQALSNIYEMYYSQAMNLECAQRGDQAANRWACEVQRCFERDAALCREYNKEMSGGKWDGMMTQKHIGYTIWNDSFPADKLPETRRVEPSEGGCSFPADPRGYTAIEAPHHFSADGSGWTEIPYMGRTLGALALMPYTEEPDGQALRYRVELPERTTDIKLHVIVKSTLAWNGRGHSFRVECGGSQQTVCFNGKLNEDPENIYSVYYPTVARRVVESVVELPAEGGWNEISIYPLDAGIVFEKFVVDCGGYEPQFLFGTESKFYKSEKTYK